MCPNDWMSSIGNWALLGSVVTVVLGGAALLLTALFVRDLRGPALTALGTVFIPVCVIPVAALMAFMTAMAHISVCPGAEIHALTAGLGVIAFLTATGFQLLGWRAALTRDPRVDAPGLSLAWLMVVPIALIGWCGAVFIPSLIRAHGVRTAPPAAYCGVWQAENHDDTLTIGANGEGSYHHYVASGARWQAAAGGRVTMDETQRVITLQSGSGNNVWTVQYPPHNLNGRTYMTLEAQPDRHSTVYVLQAPSAGGMLLRPP